MLEGNACLQRVSATEDGAKVLEEMLAGQGWCSALIGFRREDEGTPSAAVGDNVVRGNL